MNPLALPTLLLVPALVLPAAQPATRTETRAEALAMGGKLWIAQQDGKLCLQAHTTDGTIQIGNPAVVMGEVRRDTFKGRIPGREQVISLRTVDGDIRVD